MLAWKLRYARELREWFGRPARDLADWQVAQWVAATRAADACFARAAQVNHG